MKTSLLITQVLSEYKHGLKKHVDDYVKLHPDVPAGLIKKYIKENTIKDVNGILAVNGRSLTDAMNNKELERVTDVSAQILGIGAELAYLARGVSIHIEDTEFAQALMRTKYSCEIGDLRLPFPAVRFTFASPVRISDEGTLNGVTLAKLKTILDVDICKLFNVSPQSREVLNSVYELGCYSHGEDIMRETLVLIASSPEAGNDIISWPPDVPIDTTNDPELLARYSKDEDLAAETVALHRLVAGLLLYIESQQRDAVLVKSDIKAHKLMNGSPCVAKQLKSRPVVTVRDLISPTKTIRDNHEGTGMGTTKRAHWRIGHPRVLRDERYTRNEDGSARVVWVSPTVVNADDKPVHGIRKIAAK